MPLSEGNLTRPKRVQFAVNLLYLSLGLRVVGKIVILSPGLKTIGIELITRLAPLVIIFYIISKGRNWARIIFLVAFILFVPIRVFNLLKIWTSNPIGISVYFIYYLIQAVAIALIYQKESTAWFNRVSSMAAKPKGNVSVPIQVTTAMTLLYISLTVYVFVSLDILADIMLGIIKLPPKIAFQFLLKAYVASCAIALFLTYLVGEGKNWARITLLLFFILGVIGSIVISVGGFSQIVVNYACIYLAIIISIAMVFLFKKESNEWFRRSKRIVQPAKPTDAD
jgi:hypothetical protein